MFRAVADKRRPLLEDLFAVLGLDEVEFVYQAEDVSVGAEFLQCVDDGVVCVQVSFELAGFNVEDVDQDGNVGENVASLRG